LTAKAFAELKVDLEEEKAVRLTTQIDVDVLSRATKDLKISTDRFATQIPTLEDKVKYLENKVEDGLKEIQAGELCLECSTQVNNDYTKQNAQLTKKLESNSFGHFLEHPIILE
jgi:outer membrane murein-binding lipoprotein Lpp